MRISSAEICNGDRMSSLLTKVEWYSCLFERGFATYSEDAKTELPGIDPILINHHDGGAKPQA